MGFGFRPDGDREREAAELRILFATVRSHERASTDAKCGVHHLVFKAWRNTAGRWRFRTLIVAHEHIHLGTKCFTVKCERFIATAAKEQVRLDISRCHYCLSLSSCTMISGPIPRSHKVVERDGVESTTVW